MLRALAIVLVFVTACAGGTDEADLAVTEHDLSTVLVTDGGVQCGAVQCHAQLSQICCVEPTYEFCGSSEACSAGIALYCSGPSDCTSGVCCQTSATTVSCAPSCSGALVCRDDADCPSSAPRCCGALGGAHHTCAAGCP